MVEEKNLTPVPAGTGAPSVGKNSPAVTVNLYADIGYFYATNCYFNMCSTYNVGVGLPLLPITSPLIKRGQILHRIGDYVIYIPSPPIWCNNTRHKRYPGKLYLKMLDDAYYRAELFLKDFSKNGHTITEAEIKAAKKEAAKHAVFFEALAKIIGVLHGRVIEVQNEKSTLYFKIIDLLEQTKIDGKIAAALEAAKKTDRDWIYHIDPPEAMVKYLVAGLAVSPFDALQDEIYYTNFYYYFPRNTLITFSSTLQISLPLESSRYIFAVYEIPVSYTVKMPETGKIRVMSNLSFSPIAPEAWKPHLSFSTQLLEPNDSYNAFLYGSDYKRRFKKHYKYFFTDSVAASVISLRHLCIQKL